MKNNTETSYKNTLFEIDLKLFFSVLKREIVPLVILNVMFVIYSLPVVTVGASYFALNTVVMKILRNEDVDVRADFNEAFTSNFMKGIIQGILFVIVTLTIFAMFNFYMVVNKFFMLLMGVVGVLFLMVSSYVFPLSVSADLPLKYVYKNSAVMCIDYLKNSVMTVLLQLILFLFCSSMLPITLPYVLLLGISFSCLLNSFFIEIAIKDYKAEIDEEQLIIEENQEGTFANTLNQEFENEFG